MKTLVILGVLHLLYFSLKAQTIHSTYRSSFLGLSAYSQLHNDAFSLLSNQGVVAKQKSIRVGISSERLFSLEELANHQLVLSLPLLKGGVGIKAKYFGSSFFNQSQGGLSYARVIGDKLSIGAGVNFHRLSLNGYGNAQVFTGEIAALFQLSSKLTMGITVDNPIGGKFGINKREKLPSIYKMGWGFDASEKVGVSVEITKEESQPVEIVSSVIYKPIQVISTRLGLSTSDIPIWASVGWEKRKFNVAISASYHQYLGITPGVIISYSFN